MIKTLLAGTVLSTGLFAGGVLGTEDVNTDKSVEKEKIEWQKTEQGEKPDTSKPIAIKKNKDGSISVKQINPSEVEGEWSTTKSATDKSDKNSETVDRPEGTDSKPVTELPTQDGEVGKAELDDSRPAPENPEDQPTKVERQPV